MMSPFCRSKKTRTSAGSVGPPCSLRYTSAVKVTPSNAPIAVATAPEAKAIIPSGLPGSRSWMIRATVAMNQSPMATASTVISVSDRIEPSCDAK